MHDKIESGKTKPPNRQGWAMTLKRSLPRGVSRPVTRLYNAVLGVVPYQLKYGLGGLVRRHRPPYSVIDDGDLVVQVGAPRDILKSGRSRAVYFARRVGSGKAIIIEPDPESMGALRSYVAKHGLASSVWLCEKGAWKSKDRLTFVSNSEHPASNRLDVISADEAGTFEADRSARIAVDVDSIDSIVRAAGFGTPKLISITTNGAEIPILEGMAELRAKGIPYISLAPPKAGLIAFMEGIGYTCISRDDRGFFFKRSGSEG